MLCCGRQQDNERLRSEIRSVDVQIALLRKQVVELRAAHQIARDVYTLASPQAPPPSPVLFQEAQTRSQDDDDTWTVVLTPRDSS